MRISWDSHEKMTFSWEFSNSHENLSRGFLLMRISFFSWELKAHKNLVRFLWDSHEKMTFSWDFLMSFFTGENLIFLTSVESSWESHEILMRKPSHENFVSAFSHDCIVYSLDQVILIENVVSWVFSISRESKYSMHARCVSERKPFRSSFFF